MINTFQLARLAYEQGWGFFKMMGILILCIGTALVVLYGICELPRLVVACLE